VVDCAVVLPSRMACLLARTPQTPGTPGTQPVRSFSLLRLIFETGPVHQVLLHKHDSVCPRESRKATVFMKPSPASLADN
jgi:hypothetical protein